MRFEKELKFPLFIKETSSGDIIYLVKFTLEDVGLLNLCVFLTM